MSPAQTRIQRKKRNTATLLAVAAVLLFIWYFTLIHPHLRAERLNELESAAGSQFFEK